MRTLVNAYNLYEIIDDLANSDYDPVVVDTETNGLNSFKGDRIVGISIYLPQIGSGYYFPVRHVGEWNINERDYSWLLNWLQLSNNLIFFNAKFDLHMLAADGLDVEKISAIEDVILAAQLLNENEWLSNGGKKGAYKLKRLASRYLGPDAVADEKQLEAEAKQRGLNPKSDLWQLPAWVVAPYAIGDVEITWGLREHYRPALERWQQWKLYQERSLFVLKALWRMEHNGFYVNEVTVRELQSKIEPRLEEIQLEFDTALTTAGIKFDNKKSARMINLNSPAQVKAFFKYAGHNLQSTDAFTMASLAEQGIRWAELILEYRNLSKANTTYYTPYLEMRDADGFVHPSINAIGTETGRLSCDNPNLQQVPRKDTSEVKKVFEPRTGYTLVSVDEKQAELRIGAFYANEITMIRMFNDGTDLHQWTADQMHITRQIAKNANFGLIFGMGAQRAMNYIGVKTLSESEKVVSGWRKLYPAFIKANYAWQDQAKQYRTPDGKPGGDFQYIRLFNNRVRHYHELLKYGYDYTKDAWNFQVQGTNAAVLEASVLKIMYALPDNEIVKPIMMIHDSLLLEVKTGYLAEVLPIIKKAMTDWPDFNPKLGVDVEVSNTTWYNMVKV